MKQNWDRAIETVLIWEGGWTGYRKQEPGGYAMRGISMDTFKEWRAKQGKPVPTPDDLKNHSLEETKQIYYEEYGKKIDFDNLPSGYDLMSLHYAIMFGPGRGDILDKAHYGWGYMNNLARGDIGYLNALAMQTKMHREDVGPRIDPETGKHTFFGAGWSDRCVAVYLLARELRDGHTV